MLIPETRIPESKTPEHVNGSLLREKYSNGKEKEFYEECRTTARKIIQRMLYKYPNDIEDVLQEVMLIVWGKLDSFKGDSNFSTWLTSITRNHVLDFLRKKSFREGSAIHHSLNDILGESTLELGASLVDPIDLFKILEDKIAFRQIINIVKLKFLEKEKELNGKRIEKLRKDREFNFTLLEMRYFQGMSFGEMSKVLNIKESTLKVKVFRFLESIQEILKENHIKF